MTYWYTLAETVCGGFLHILSLENHSANTESRFLFFWTVETHVITFSLYDAVIDNLHVINVGLLGYKLGFKDLKCQWFDIYGQ